MMLTVTKHQSNETESNRLVIVSNRLPITLSRESMGHWDVQPSIGGLVTALRPILRARGGLWIGWLGIREKVNLDKLLAIASRHLDCTLTPVSLTEKEVNLYYFGFSNEIIWPLFHDLQTRCNFDPAYWKAYQRVNQKFAQVIVENSEMGDYIWVHDYHLMLVAKELRSIGVENKLGFFLHTPFPPPDIFAKLPWYRRILEDLLEYDLLGFQTPRDRNNFLQCIEVMLKGLRVDARRKVSMITTPKRLVGAGSFPISIDFREFTHQAASEVVAEGTKRLRQALPNQQMILGVDRLDYSKGIPEKLRAFKYALTHFNSLRGKVSLIQIVVPSREDISEYQALRVEIEGLVSEINGKFTLPGWIPVHYMYRSFGRTALLAYYRAADIALIVPLKDGMNLVAKEYCATRIDKSGVLILSDFAGAASQLHKYSLLVNPYDIEGVANAIYQAYKMGPDEKQRRMRKLRQSVAKRDIFWWVDFFFRTAFNMKRL